MRHFSALGQFTPGPSFVCGQNSLNATGAAFVNGSLGNILEMDDVHRASILHAGDIIIPATLAIAQERNSSPGELLDSIVKGYEIALRLGAVAATGGYSNWYNSGTCGVFGAAFSCAQILGLSKAQIRDCLGQAGMLCSGIWQCRLESTWSKQLAAANAASNGVMSALLGQQNFPGARYIFEGEAGFFKTYYPATDIEKLNLDPVQQWLLHEVSFKPWPACRHNHPAIEAALQLRDKLELERITEITIETYGAAIDFCDNPDPATDHEARFSLQHCVAVGLLWGEPVLADFDQSSRADAEIVSLRKKITLVKNQSFDSRFPQQLGSALMVTLNDGEKTRIAIDNARGDPENPMSLEELESKFRHLASVAAISPTHTDHLLEILLDPSEAGMGDESLAALSRALANTVADMQSVKQAER